MPPRRLTQRPPMLAYAARGDASPVEVHRFGADHPAMGQALHGHRFFELLYLESARGWHRVGAERVAARPGQLYVLAPGEVHDARGLRAPRGWLSVFRADALGAERFDGQPFAAVPGELVLLAFLRPPGGGPLHFQLPPADRPRWSARFAALARELEGGALGYAEAAEAHLRLLLIDAARLAAPRFPGLTVGARPLLARVFQFIEGRFTQPISLADVARAVGRSGAYLTDLVRRQTGRSVLAWIIERRMAEARRLLLETDRDVGEIAEAVSYVDAGYFIRQFRALHGTTPLAWRRGRR